MGRGSATAAFRVARDRLLVSALEWSALRRPLLSSEYEIWTKVAVIRITKKGTVAVATQRPKGSQ
jgi:hypothetical protein